MTEDTGELGVSYSLYKDKLGGWQLHSFDTESGTEDWRAASSEAVARKFARDEWGVKRWKRKNKYSFTAFVPDEETFTCTHGCGPLQWVDDQWYCPVCGDEWPDEVVRETAHD